MDYLLSFLEGIITFISPCLLPMLPVYVSYFTAGETEQKGRALKNAFGFVVGFTIVFVSLGAFAGTLGRFLKDYVIAFNIVSGLIVMAFGLHFMGILKIKFLLAEKRIHHNIKNFGFFPSLLFGIIFSIGWTPCVGAFLGSALMLAAHKGESVKGILMLLSFSAGLGVPFIASAVLINRLKTTFDFIKRHYKTINLISGGLLVVVGIFMATGLMGHFLSVLTF